MASIRKRGGKWQVQVRRGGHESSSRTFLSKSDAEKWGRHQEHLLDQDDLPGDKGILKRTKFCDLLLRYRTEITPRKKSVKQESNRLDRLLRHPIAQLRLDRIQSKHFAAFRDERLERVGQQAVRHDINVLGHVFTVATRDWGFPFNSNPVSKIAKPLQSRPRERRVAKSEMSHLEGQAARANSPSYLLPLIYVAVETGMRKSELLGLRWENLDEQASTVVLPETKNGYAREVPLSPHAMEAIKSQSGSHPELMFPVAVATLRRHWTRLLRACEITGLHFHDLRHEAISRHFERGLSVAEVSLISGHRDPRQLFRYVHPRPADVARKLGMMDTFRDV